MTNLSQLSYRAGNLVTTLQGRYIMEIESSGCRVGYGAPVHVSEAGFEEGQFATDTGSHRSEVHFESR